MCVCVCVGWGCVGACCLIHNSIVELINLKRSGTRVRFRELLKSFKPPRPASRPVPSVGAEAAVGRGEGEPGGGWECGRWRGWRGAVTVISWTLSWWIRSSSRAGFMPVFSGTQHLAEWFAKLETRQVPRGGGVGGGANFATPLQLGNVIK